MVDLQRGNGGSEAVHRSGGSNGHERDAQPEAEKAGHIVDGTGADRNGNVAVCRLVDQQLPEGGFVKLRMRQNMETGGDTGLGQNFHTAVPGDLAGDAVADQVRVAAAQLM